MILTAIVAGIVGMWIGFVIACLIRVSGDREDDAWQMWVDHLLAQEGNGDRKPEAFAADNLVVLERGELAEIERLSALLERCRPYMQHNKIECLDWTHEFDGEYQPCQCGYTGILEELDGWVKAGDDND